MLRVALLARRTPSPPTPETRRRSELAAAAERSAVIRAVIRSDPCQPKRGSPPCPCRHRAERSPLADPKLHTPAAPAALSPAEPSHTILRRAEKKRVLASEDSKLTVY